MATEYLREILNRVLVGENMALKVQVKEKKILGASNVVERGTCEKGRTILDPRERTSKDLNICDCTYTQPLTNKKELPPQTTQTLVPTPTKTPNQPIKTHTPLTVVPTQTLQTSAPKTLTYECTSFNNKDTHFFNIYGT